VNDAGTCAQIDTKLAQRCSRRVLFEQRALPAIASPPLVFEDDDGRFRFDLSDCAPSFESRDFARDVWLKQTSHGGDLPLAT
jgi:hypothetical protein